MDSSNTSYDSNLVKARSRSLVMKASVEGSKHLQNGDIKLKLIRTYNKVADDIVRNYEYGHRSLNDALQDIKRQADSLYFQSRLIRQYKNTYPKALNKSVTFAAGISQAVEGGVGAFLTWGTCVYCDVMFLHGINNIYEGGAYFLNGGREVDGFLKKFYQYFASISGHPAEYGNVAYDAADFALSIKGILGLTEKMKASRYAVEGGRTSRFILFNAYKVDFLRGYQKMSSKILFSELGADIFTLDTLINDINSAKKITKDYSNRNDSNMNDVLNQMLTNQVK